MSQRVTIALSTPLVGHAGPITDVVLREPTAGEYFSLGEVSTIARTGDGGFYTIDLPETRKAYIEACIVEPKDKVLVLGQLSLTDGMKVAEAIDRFLLAARSAITAP